MEIIYIISITISVLLGGLLIPNIKNNKANLFLFGILFIATTGGIVNIILLNNEEQNYLYFISFVDALPSIFGVLLYYYVKHTIYPNSKIRTSYLLYLIPFIIALSLILFSTFYGIYNVFILIIIHIVLKNLFSLYFIILTIYKFNQYKVYLLKTYSVIEQIEYKWLKFLTYIALFFWIIYLIMVILIFSNVHFPFNLNSIIYISLALFIFTISAYGVYNTNTFSKIKITKANVNLNETSSFKDKKKATDNFANYDIRKEFEKIEKYILSTKPFLNKDLTLQDLSKLVNLHPKKCSEIINKSTNSNYFDFINTFRINYFNEQIVKPENKNITIIAVAFNSGFSSKSTFNRTYKKLTGISPSQYLSNTQK